MFREKPNRSQRVACIDIPDLFFQWMILQQADWVGQPLALLRDNRATAIIENINILARQVGLRRGMRYREALLQVPQLRARYLLPALKERIKLEMIARLRAFSPHIEACSYNDSVFYVALKGLHLLYPDWSAWRHQLADCLKANGYIARIVVGFSRFGCLAVSRHERPVWILESSDQEVQLAQQVSLSCLGLAAVSIKTLTLLGIHCLGDFLKLSPESLLQRFGREVYEFRRRFDAKAADLLCNMAEEQVWQAHLSLDYVESDRLRLLSLCQRLLQPLLLQLSRQNLATKHMHLDLHLQKGGLERLTLSLSEPSLDLKSLLKLLDLRLQTQALHSGITDLQVHIEAQDCPAEQLELFAHSSRPELQAANRALDLIRAQLGPQAVVIARLQAGHLPGSQFKWEILSEFKGNPQPGRRVARIVRRFFATPQVCKPSQRKLLLNGPYRLSGAWWHREIERDYYFLLTPQGEIHWSFFDQQRKSWLQEGLVD